MKSDARGSTLSLGFGMTRHGVARTPVEEEKTPTVRKAQILVVDRDPAVGRVMKARLGAIYAVQIVEDGKSALNACVVARPNLVIIDMPMPDMDGLEFLKELKSRWPQLTAIMLTSHGSIPEAVRAIHAGAFSYLVKPIEREELMGQVQRALEVSTHLSEYDWRASLEARSQLLKDRLAISNRAAAGEEAILLNGRSGAGKELFARAIHSAGSRRQKPFVLISCRDSPAATLGAFELARGGTLFLDEIGDLPIELQATLAAVLGQQSERASGPRSNRRSVRVMCSSSCDLRPLVDSGKLLAELYAQINVLPIETPPLGCRREDIPSLISHFLEQAVEPGGKRIYTRQAIELLAAKDWPENVRQLFDLVRRNMALTGETLCDDGGAPQSADAGSSQIPTYDEARDRFSRDYLKRNLEHAAGNVTHAARLAKRNRTDFYKLLARYRLHPEDYKLTGRRSDQDARQRDD